MTRRLVITADDLGRDPGTNEAIAALIADGAASAASVIAVADQAAAGVAAVRAHGVEPHVHVTLTSERDLRPWEPLSDGVGDRLPIHAGDLTASADQIIAEADAQLQWLIAQGVRPAAADAHAGVLYGLHGASQLSETLQWCAMRGLGFRLPRDASLYVGGALPAPLAEAHASAVRLADELRVAIPAAILTNRCDHEQLTARGGYAALRDDLVRALEYLPEGISELFLHPSGPGAVAGPAGVVREWEGRMLRDPVWRHALDEQDIEIVTEW